MSKSKTRLWIERSHDGDYIYIRQAPGKKWDAQIDFVSGSQWIFQDLAPGMGAFFTLVKETQKLS